MEQMKAALVGIDAVIDETYGWGDSYALDTFMTGFNFTAADVASGDYPFLSSMTLRHDALKVNHEESGSWGTAWFDDQHWRSSSRTFSWSAYDESPARCWRPSIRLERAHQAPDQGRRAPIANRVRVGPRQPSCYRSPDACILSCRRRIGAEAGARDGLTSTAD